MTQNQNLFATTGYVTCSGSYLSGSNQYIDHADSRGKIITTTSPKPTPKPSIMNTVFSDIKSFISQHRGLIYGLAIVLLVDHFFLGNKLTARIKATVEKMLGYVENKVDHAIGHPVTVTTPVVTPPVS